MIERKKFSFFCTLKNKNKRVQTILWSRAAFNAPETKRISEFANLECVVVRNGKESIMLGFSAVPSEEFLKVIKSIKLKLTN